MQVERAIEVQYTYTNDAKTAQKWLDSLPDLIAVDFETAVRYTKEEQTKAKELSLLQEIEKLERIKQQAIANASALGHPYHCTITHCSIAWTERDAFVFIIDAQPIADTVLQFLITTLRKQIWHNYGYDGRFLKYYAGGDAPDVEDTQIMAKTIINHVEVFKAKTGLKDLAGAWYGDWGISSDSFNASQQYEEYVIKYAATDACATWKLFQYLNTFIDEDCKTSEEEEEAM